MKSIHLTSKQKKIMQPKGQYSHDVDPNSILKGPLKEEA